VGVVVGAKMSKAWAVLLTSLPLPSFLFTGFFYSFFFLLFGAKQDKYKAKATTSNQGKQQHVFFDLDHDDNHGDGGAPGPGPAV
jgi:hypothetical protein